MVKYRDCIFAPSLFSLSSTLYSLLGMGIGNCITIKYSSVENNKYNINYVTLRNLHKICDVSHTRWNRKGNRLQNWQTIPRN